MIYFIVGIEVEGSICVEGDFSGLYNVTAQNDFDNFPLKNGMVKKELTQSAYLGLQDSYDEAKRCYCKGAGIEGEVLMDIDPSIEAQIKELKPEPHKLRYVHARKKAISVEFFDDNVIVSDSSEAVKYARRG